MTERSGGPQSAQILLALSMSEKKAQEGKENAAEDWASLFGMAVLVEYLVFDIMGELCFAESFEAKEPGDNMLNKSPRPDFESTHVRIQGMRASDNSNMAMLWYENDWDVAHCEATTTIALVSDAFV
jgi:hypothetical protein